MEDAERSNQLSPLHKRNEVQYETQAFRLGLRGGSFTEATPALASMLRNSAVHNGSAIMDEVTFALQ